MYSINVHRYAASVDLDSDPVGYGSKSGRIRVPDQKIIKIRIRDTELTF
jgi:hypothetical protein